MRVIIGQIVHETNTFSTVLATKKHFQMSEWDFREVVLERHHGVKDYLGGMIDEAERLGIQVIPTFSAFTRPSGVIERETYEELKREFIQTILDAGNIDAICFNLHGAGVAEQTEDIEGDLLEELRRCLGKSIPIVITLDLHANVTEKMVEHADMLIGVKEYPHIDSYEIGIKAMRWTEAMVKEKIQPTMHFISLPLMIPLSTSFTSPVKDINEICRGWEEMSDVIECSFYHGFPYADIAEVGCSIVTITLGDQEKAKEMGEKLADYVINVRKDFFPPILSPQAGIVEALKGKGFPVVLNETSDNPGGGAPGDGTHLLRAMIESGVAPACFGTIFDPETAEQAHLAGVGQWISVRLGGKIDPVHGAPLEMRVYVKSLTDGQYTQSSPMWTGMKVNLGKSARLQANGIDIVVCSWRSQVFDDQIFRLHGIFIQDYKIVGLKSSNHFRAFFGKVTDSIITVSAPGWSSVNLSDFRYCKVVRKVYPFHEI
ncbi:M81 family metallopeptidase [Ammoniphilus sp. CFH 90114]|uniref:M81 family metallopeptidase n=1 Tax=Ammoniphilus sp. CFH 90114 TaxID=2493665 RepID=UPI00100DADA8|nr:M81 family metallopeptidase [Ammoniphilus sp. CFH 90114]RXT07142.1 M81 family peptidase [Ammoniphilus sp. CFH 90114]